MAMSISKLLMTVGTAMSITMVNLPAMTMGISSE